MTIDLDIQGLRRELADTRALLSLQVPSVVGKVWLVAHWPGWGWARIRRELRQRIGVAFKRGQSVAITRSDVMEIDRQIQMEALERRKPLLVAAVEDGHLSLRAVIARGFGDHSAASPRRSTRQPGGSRKDRAAGLSHGDQCRRDGAA